MADKKINELFDFKGKSVVITGGAMGIGFAMAKRFAEAGANVVIADIDETGEAKSQELAKEYGNKVIFVKTDVSSEEDMKNFIAKAMSEFGRIDVMINNAGIFPMKPVMEMDLAFWEKTLNINLRSVFLGSREAAKVMKAGSVIINTASVDALRPSMVGLAAYDSSKHGVWGFTKNFALEMAEKNIRVNAIAPGGVRTEGVEHMTAGKVKAAGNEIARADVPMKRMAEPDEIATVALFLASDASSYMTGSMVVADGGMLLK